MPTTDLPDEPTPANPARIPKKPFTADEIRDLAEAMALPDVNNNVAAAAAVLRKKYPDTSYQRWYKIAKSNDYLSAIHPSSKPEEILPTNADAIDRVPLITPREIEEARAVAKQAELIAREDWESIGLTAQQAERMRSMERFSRNPLRQLAESTHGGLGFLYGNLLEIADKALEMIRNPESELDAEGVARSKQAVVRDNMYVALAASAEIRQVKKQVDHSLLVMQKVQQMEGEKGGGKKRGKPGFGALVAVKAEAGATVTISDGSK